MLRRSSRHALLVNCYRLKELN